MRDAVPGRTSASLANGRETLPKLFGEDAQAGWRTVLASDAAGRRFNAFVLQRPAPLLGPRPSAATPWSETLTSRTWGKPRVSGSWSYAGTTTSPRSY